MANIIDYVKWRGDISFSESPLNVIDALIFSELSYVHFDDLVPASVVAKGIPLSTLSQKFFSLHYDRNKIGLILPTDEIHTLFKLAAGSRRFSGVTVKGFINEVDAKTEKQFCAMCFDIGKSSTMVAFRGTDDTLIGWKEDLNMSFFTPVPSQKQAAEYLNSVIRRNEREHYYLCGHSKGGNLASYAAIKCDPQAQEKIKASFSFDGPGFKKSFLRTSKKCPILQRIYKFAPEGTLIGAIFHPVESCYYVESDAKGLYQHDAFSWQVMGKSFIFADAMSKGSLDFHNTLENLVENMTDAEKIEFVDALYRFLTVNEATTLTDIASDKLKFIFGILKTDDKTKKTVFGLMNRLLKEKYFPSKPKKK